MKVVLDISAFQSPAQLDALLKNADDEIVGVYIKATQGLYYTDDLASMFVSVCQKHNTAYGYYDFMTNDQTSDQEKYFADFIRGLPAPSLKMMMDAEGSYDKWAAGTLNFETAYGHPGILYAQLSNMPKYKGSGLIEWVAQYDSMSYYRPQQSEIDAYTQQGYALWQWTSNYMGFNQDASVLLADFEVLKYA